MSNQAPRSNLFDESTWPMKESLSADPYDKGDTVILPHEYLNFAISHG